jgi:putative SOS response-associated peptidase YedK
MPVILSEDQTDAWLNKDEKPSDLKKLLGPTPDGTLVIKRVSPEVNSVKNDYPEVLREYQGQLL